MPNPEGEGGRGNKGENVLQTTHFYLANPTDNPAISRLGVGKWRPCGYTHTQPERRGRELQMFTVKYCKKYAEEIPISKTGKGKLTMETKIQSGTLSTYYARSSWLKCCRALG